MIFWTNNVDSILQLNEKPVLSHKGSVTNVEMEQQVREIYNRFDARRKIEAAKEADLQDLEDIEKRIKKRK